MAGKKGSGLLMVWTDIPPDKEEGFNRWYNEEHLPELLSIPGFLNAARYEAVRGGPKYLACYELETPDAVNSPVIKKHQSSPSEWSPRIIGTNFVGNVYEQIFPAQVTQQAASGDMAPVLQCGRMGIPADVEDEFNQWYNTVYVPNYEKVASCISGRRYRTVRGEPRYGVVYELEHEDVSLSAEWTAARDSHPDNERMRSLMQHASGSPGVYKKVFPL